MVPYKRKTDRQIVTAEKIEEAKRGWRLGKVNGKSLDPSGIETIYPENRTLNISRPIVGISTIFPLPQIKVEVGKNQKRKRRAQKSEVITSSPFKNDLEAKEKEKQDLEKAKQKRIVERALKKNVKADGKIIKKPNIKKQLKYEDPKPSHEDPKPSTSSAQAVIYEDEEDESTLCAGCGHSYSDDWVQCGLCKEWWHEDCSAYEGSGPFICDYC